MKKSTILTMAIAVMLSSCGTTARYASSDKAPMFQDGIYNNTPAFRTPQQKEEDRTSTEELVRKTKESAIYLIGEKKDTIMIPENMSAMIKFDQKIGGTVVTVGENPYDWRNDLENNYGYWYGPYSIGSSWYWSRHYNPWYWNSWAYTPWRYHGWYDPFYISGWYDPWYYGYGGWYDPWYYGWHHHHYCGWYGGWDPHWGHHHGPGHIGGDRPEKGRDRWYGLRASTGSGKIASGTTSIRGGGTRMGTTRGESLTRTSTVTRRTGQQARSAATRVTGAASSARLPKNTGMTGTVSTNRKPATVESRPAGRYTGNSIYRRPSSETATRSTYGERQQTTGGSTSTSYRNESRPNSERSYERSTSTYNRSSSYERSSSSYSSPSGSRSSGSYGGGSSGGYSRSSSGGARRR